MSRVVHPGGPHRIQSVIPTLSFLPGPQLTQVSVLQYGSTTTAAVPWNVAYEKAHLLSHVDVMQREGGLSHIGNLPQWPGTPSGLNSWHLGPSDLGRSLGSLG